MDSHTFTPTTEAERIMYQALSEIQSRVNEYFENPLKFDKAPFGVIAGYAHAALFLLEQNTPQAAAPVAAQAADGGTGVRYVVIPIEENFFIQDTVRGLIPAIGFATRGIAQATVDNLNAGQRFFAHECFIYEAKSFTVERWYDSEHEANTEAARLNAGNGNGGGA
jgi:hypothetical protein